MTFPDDSAPRPGPHMMPGVRRTDDRVDVVDPGLAEAVPARVRELLAQVDEISEQVGDTTDLVALAKQTRLLEQAHEVLTTALSEVDRR